MKTTTKTATKTSKTNINLDRLKADAEAARAVLFGHHGHVRFRKKVHGTWQTRVLELVEQATRERHEGSKAAAARTERELDDAYSSLDLAFEEWIAAVRLAAEAGERSSDAWRAFWQAQSDLEDANADKAEVSNG
jgi:hypothetical protein